MPEQAYMRQSPQMPPIRDLVRSALRDRSATLPTLDEARSEAERDYLAGALRLALRLTQNEHFVLRVSRMAAELTEAGRAAVEGVAALQMFVESRRCHPAEPGRDRPCRPDGRRAKGRPERRDGRRS